MNAVRNSSRKLSSIAFVSSDAGGARALVPVESEMRGRGHHTVVFASGPSVGIWQSEQVNLCVCSDEDPVEAHLTRLERRFDLLVSAAGLYNWVEHRMRVAAQRLSIPVVAVQDSWLNYGERFARNPTGEPEKSRVEIVCAIDDYSAEQFLRAGVCRAARVCGAANLESSVRRVKSLRPRRLEIRAGIGFKGRILAVFFSDPFRLAPAGRPSTGPGGLCADNGQSLFGYDSIGVLNGTLDRLASAGIDALGVLVKPHPLEFVPLLHEVVKGYSGRMDVFILPDISPADCLAAADLVFGMMSIALLEAALSGLPALSIEPGLLQSGQEDPCVSNTLGYTTPAYSWDAVDDWIDAFKRGYRGSAPAVSFSVEGASKAVADVCDEVLSG